MQLAFIKNNVSIGERFKKSDRISLTRDIQVTRKQGERILVRPFVVFKRQNVLAGPRLAVGLAKKSGSSVERNRAKRKLREFFRKNKTALANYDYLFYASQPVGQLSADAWRALLDRLLIRLKVK